LTIYSVLSEKSLEDVEAAFKMKNYSDFKDSLADLLVSKLSKFQKKYQEIRSNDAQLRQILDEGCEYARTKSSQTLKIVKEKMGLA